MQEVDYRTLENSVETPSSLDDYDSNLDEWEPFRDKFAPDGTRLPAIPRTHDRTKLATGRCDGGSRLH